MKRKRRKFTKEFKEEAVKYVLEQSYQFSVASRNLGIHSNLLGRWKREYENGAEEGSGSRSSVSLRVELNRLRKENKRLKMEREILKRRQPSSQRNRREIHFIDSARKVYPLCLLCKVMRVSRSGYYSWRDRSLSARDREREQLIPRVKAIHYKSRSTYGKRRIAEELQSEGISCGEHKAGTLMKLANVQVKQRKKLKATSDSKHNLPVSPNLLKRKFTVLQPNMVWVGDITYIWTEEGWLYLAIVIDLYSRRVVGWSIDKWMTKQLIMDAILMAIWRRKPAPGLILHSDKGSQYCSHAFQKLVHTHAIRSSMRRKGGCWDNAVAESFFGTLK